LLGVALVLGVLVGPVFAHGLTVWQTDSEFSYGYLIPAISLALLWWRRRALRDAARPGSAGGLALVLPSVAAILLAQRVGVHALAGLAVSPLLVGCAVYLWGWRVGRAVAFPAGYLLFGLGVYRGLLGSLGFALQAVTASGAAALSNLAGLDVLRDGLVLRGDGYAFVVAEPCSGMSSLLSLLALAALWGYVARGALAARATLLLAVPPAVVAANVVRVTLVLLVASRWGTPAAEGFFHGASSLALFGVATGGLLLVGRGVGCRLAGRTA
jgi:exosortase